MDYKIELLPLNAIKPYLNNAKKHSEEQIEHIANSIREFGFRQNLVIDKDNVLIAGHGRYEAAKVLGLEEVPCLRAEDLTEEQVKAYRLADNKTAESGWDFSLLDEELASITDLNMADFGFGEIEGVNLEGIDDLFTDAEHKEKEPKKIQCPHCGEYIEL